MDCLYSVKGDTHKPIYIVFEYFDDVKCEKTHECCDKQFQCRQRIRCSRIVRFVTTDRDLAIRFSKDKPTWSYQEEVLWTKLT